MNTAFILGTRPEIIKLFPVIREFERRRAPFSLIHTNQHYSPGMDEVFFSQLGLPAPEHNLEIGSGSHAGQLGGMLLKLGPLLGELRPGRVIVQGDTNTVLAGALAASRMGLPVAHVEAGLRSYDRRMPEEFNRIFADHLSDYLFAPTAQARDILLAEGFDRARIHVTGNTVVDAVLAIAGLDGVEGDEALSQRGLEPGGYVLLTLHRPENVDRPDTLREILSAVEGFCSGRDLRALFPVHPRTRARLEEFGIRLPGAVAAEAAAGYIDFVALEKNAALIITDSGGVQEEACILGVPCVTARISTERPETVDAGANMVAGVEKAGILEAAAQMIEKRGGWENPFGDGRAGERIAGIVLAG